MRVFKMKCPHCGDEVIVPGGSIDSEMRCLSCGKIFAFMSDMEGNYLSTKCPHCGSPFKLSRNDLGEKRLCYNCGGEFGFSEQRGELRLYHVYAAVLWGLFGVWLFGPLNMFFGAWLLKENFKEMGMKEEAEEYGQSIKSYIIFSIVSSLVGGVLFGLSQLTAVAAYMAGSALLGALQGFFAYICIGIASAVPGIYYFCFFVKYASKCSKAVSECLSYHEFKSSWIPAILCWLIINAAVSVCMIPAVIVMVMISIL